MVSNAAISRPDSIFANDDELALIEALCGGLPLVPQPYKLLGARLGISEEDVLQSLESLIARGIIRRFGVVVQHRRLGYTANAMVVWDIADELVNEIGERMGKFDFVTLCYQRPRRLPDWPYNLFCMVHGAKHETVLAQVRELADSLGISDVPNEVLFSSRQFKQRGARYGNGHK
ncbi:MAG: AsnC family protein [Rhodospirillaceae bacterium]|nr:AsnC family protein [Rhodospirillaceae bacterium]